MLASIMTNANARDNIRFFNLKNLQVRVYFGISIPNSFIQIDARRSVITMMIITFVLGLMNIALKFSHFINSRRPPLTIMVATTSDMTSNIHIDIFGYLLLLS
jgi:hypothetical protein